MPYSGLRPKKFYPAIDDLVHDLAVAPNDIIELEHLDIGLPGCILIFKSGMNCIQKKKEATLKKYIKRAGETDRPVLGETDQSVAKQLLALEVTARMDNSGLYHGTTEKR